MLLSFSVQNYRSFREEQTISLFAVKRLGDTVGSAHCVEVPATQQYALRVASLYGANGAGKSNLVRALGLLKELVLEGADLGQMMAFDPFLLGGQPPEQPTGFELQFMADGEVFRYGFRYDAQRVCEEWLDVYEGEKERNLFSRAMATGGSVEVELGPGAKDASEKMRALAKVAARPNQLFLTEIRNLDDPGAQGERFRKVVGWFASRLNILRPGNRIAQLVRKIGEDDALTAFVAGFLREASSGIVDLDVMEKEIPGPAYSEQLAQFERAMSERAARGRPMPVIQEVESWDLEPSERDAWKLRWLVGLHESSQGDRVPIPFSEESDGSRRLLGLLPTLYRLTTQGGVFVIDELERSMHPNLAWKFVEFFLKAGKGTQSQLIFTTHESTLLDLDLMRRDGIWFAEKNREGATQLYSLAEFKVRNDLRIEKGYLQGRFGAIPFLGNIDRLMEEQPTPHTAP